MHGLYLHPLKSHHSGCSPFLTALRQCLRQQPHSRIRPRKCLKLAQGGSGASRGFASSTRARATHRNTPASSLLTQALDQRQSAGQGSQSDTAGPFSLGTIQRNGPKQKKWNELSTKGKVIRSTERTSNFTVIAVGAGLTAVLAYALLSELFAKNSPTVRYNEACTLISSSPAVRAHLPGKLNFHNNPPSAIRPRHRNRHVSSMLVEDREKREHLLLNFYVRAAPEGAAWGEEGVLAGLWERAKTMGEESWTWEEMTDWANESARSTRDSARRLFLYLTGESASGASGASYPFGSGAEGSTPAGQAPARRETHIGRNSDEGGGLWASVTGLFSGIGKNVGSASGGKGNSAERRGEIYEEAEVHCDLVKNDEGKYEWRYIIVDMPNSRARYPNRVFVKRAPDVKELEAVMRWS